MSKPISTMPSLLRDRAQLLHAASSGAEYLERRCESAAGPTVTLSRDELHEIAEQFARVTALLITVHLDEVSSRRVA